MSIFQRWARGMSGPGTGTLPGPDAGADFEAVGGESRREPFARGLSIASDLESLRLTVCPAVLTHAA
jgi:hypothetical protein